MIKLIDGEIAASEVLNRKINSYGEYESVVSAILADVREGGDEAVLEYCRKFDCKDLTELRVTDAEIEQALNNVSAEYKKMLERSIANIKAFHAKQVKEGFCFTKGGGEVLGQRYTPIERVGVYVPGGTASYPSTVLMNIIPAVIAGVGEVIMTTPVAKDGKIRDEILCAAYMAGADKIFKCGGAQAVGAMAYGTESIPKVDKIVGPGNIFVALAKKQVFGIVGIDMIAGPSEILVIADGVSDVKAVAADLLSQAEHDKLATAVLITDSKEFALAVQAELERQILLLSRSEIARASIDNNGKIIVVNSIDKAIEISNIIAPEHLEIVVDEPMKYLDKIRNAGSIFLGRNTPEALGDYYAGPNHTLPTGGSAKFSSPLSVDDFVKKSSYICYTRSALEQAKEDVTAFAGSEGLDAHARSVEIRFED